MGQQSALRELHREQFEPVYAVEGSSLDQCLGSTTNMKRFENQEGNDRVRP